MEGDERTPDEPGYPVDPADAECISKLSTFLADTIQDTKESVSLIENLFCKQLFPDFQSKLRKIYSKAKKAAEDEWKEKENGFIVQVKRLQYERQKVCEENQSLKLEIEKLVEVQLQSPKYGNELEEELKRKTKERAERRELQQRLRDILDSKASMAGNNGKRVKELEEENKLLQKKVRVQDLAMEDLRSNLRSKCRIIEEKEESNCELLQLVQSKVLLIGQKEQQLKENNEKMNGLFAKLQNSEKKIEEIQVELMEKTEQLEQGKEFHENLVIKLKTQASEILKTRHLLNDCETENRVLTNKLRILEDNRNGLKKELQEKNEKLEEERKRQLQNGSSDSKLLKARQDFEELQNEKNLLLVKLKGLEEKVGKLQMNLGERNDESTEGMELHRKLLQQIEGKNAEILIEKQKRREVIDAYKKLKSQYNYLCTKSGLAPENMRHGTPTKASKDASPLDQNILSSSGAENKSPNGPIPACVTTDQNENQHKMEDTKEFKLTKNSTSCSPFSNKNPTSLSGTKRPVSHWRDTRPTKYRNGPDPHDDFLNTPLENIKENIKKHIKEEVHQLPGPAPKDMSFDSSDDETQEPSKQESPSPLRPEKKGFKYVESVRKKAERANLKGVECKQCKKFYDAVLPDNGGVANNQQNLRCEHHEGVSRHRYRFAPPFTPEGFWNIGFESEM